MEVYFGVGEGIGWGGFAEHPDTRTVAVAMATAKLITWRVVRGTLTLDRLLRSAIGPFTTGLGELTPLAGPWLPRQLQK